MEILPHQRTAAAAAASVDVKYFWATNNNNSSFSLSLEPSAPSAASGSLATSKQIYQVTKERECERVGLGLEESGSVAIHISDDDNNIIGKL